MFDDYDSLSDVGLSQDHLGDPVGQLIGVEDESFDVGRWFGVFGRHFLLPCLVKALCRLDLSV